MAAERRAARQGLPAHNGTRPTHGDAPKVEVRSSPRRRRTASASWENGAIVVLVPARLGVGARSAIVDELVSKLMAQSPMLGADHDVLEQRAAELADEYFDGVRPSSVRWVSNQSRRWGSCSPAKGAIRVSDRLRPVPSWVLDAVLAHELAHLLEPSHSKRFKRIVSRFPRLAEADTYLAGFALGLEVGAGHDPAQAGSAGPDGAWD